jgi:hypothetical protein
MQPEHFNICQRLRPPECVNGGVNDGTHRYLSQITHCFIKSCDRFGGADFCQLLTDNGGFVTNLEAIEAN